MAGELAALDADFKTRSIRALNYAQLTGMSPVEALDFDKQIGDDVKTLAALPNAYQMQKFNTKADEKTDPFTGAKATDYAALLGPRITDLKAAGYNTRAAAEMGIAGFMKQLDSAADFISRKTGMEKGGLFQKLHEQAVTRGEAYKSAAQKEGIGPITEFITDVVGRVVPGIDQFILDLPGLYPLHGAAAAEKAAAKGDNEFVGFFKGSMERLLMGQIFHAASGLTRPLRAATMGGLFEEQARSENPNATPEELAKAFLTGGIFGTVGGPGKIRMKDVVEEIHNLREELPQLSPSQGGPRDMTLGSERGSTGGEPPPPEEKYNFILESVGKKSEEAMAKGEKADVGAFIKQAETEWETKVNPPIEEFKAPTGESVPRPPELEALYNHAARREGLAITNEDKAASYFNGLRRVTGIDVDMVDKAEIAYVKGDYGKATELSETAMSSMHKRAADETVRQWLETASEGDIAAFKAEGGTLPVSGEKVVPGASSIEKQVKELSFLKLNPEEINTINSAVSEVSKNFNLDAVNVFSQSYTPGGNAQWRRSEKTIALQRGFSKSTLWHELGHVAYDDIMQSSKGRDILIEHTFGRRPEAKQLFEDLVKTYRKKYPTEVRYSDVDLVRVHSQQAKRSEEEFAANFKDYGGKNPKYFTKEEAISGAHQQASYDQLVKYVKTATPEQIADLKAQGVTIPEEVSAPVSGEIVQPESITGRIGGADPFEIIKNPTRADRMAMESEHKKLFPRDKSGDPEYRSTYDENGNTYIWESSKATHEDVEGIIKNKFGVESHQNPTRFGKEIVQPGGKEPIKTPTLDLGPELTLQEASDLIKAATGSKVDIAEIAKTSPSIAKLMEDTRAALTPRRMAAIKTRIRLVTGQRKVQDILEVKEMDALNDQLRYAARQAKIAFREGKKEGIDIATEHLQTLAENAKIRQATRDNIRTMIGEIKAVDPAKMTDYAREEITALLDGLDMTKLSSNKRLKLEKTRDYLDRSPDTELPDYVMDDLARLEKKPIRDLTLDELDSLHKAVMNLAAQSEKAQSLWDGIQERRYDQAMVDSVAELKPPEKVLGDIISTKPTLWDRVLSVGSWVKNTLGLRQDSYDLIVESLAGINSTPYRVLYSIVKRGDPTGVIPGKGIIGQKKHIQDAHTQFYSDLIKTGFPFDKVKNVDAWLNERVEAKGDRTWILSRGERMAFYRHTLNPDNLRAILESGIGFKRPPKSSGIEPNTVVAVTEADVRAIVDSLSPEEKLFAGAAVDNLFTKQGKELDDTFYALNKYRTPMVENYYPKEVMPLTRGGYDLETEEGMEAFRQFTARVGIDKGMLVERVGSTRPIYLGDLMGDITRSVNRSAAYINLEGPLRNASRLLYGPDTSFRKAIIDRYGRETWVELEKGLKDIAGNYRQWSETETGLMKLKTNAVAGIISLNPWIWLNQPASLIFYNTYVESKYLARGLADVATPSGAKNILELARKYSPELVDRLQTGYDRDVAAAYQQSREREFYGGGHTIVEKGIQPTKWADLTAVLPGMRASYYKAMDEFQTGQLSKPLKDALDIQDAAVVNRWTPEQMEAKAWEFADWTTERTQAQSSPEHRPPLSRGSTLEQVFTSLSSQVNTMLNLVRRTQREYRRTGLPEDRNTMLKAYFQIFVVNAAAMMGIDRMRDLLYGRESKSYVQGFIDNAAGMVMFVRELESAVSSHIFQGDRGFDTKLPVQKVGDIMVKMGANVNKMVVSHNQKEVSDAQADFIDNTLDLLATLKGLPYHTPKRLLQAVTGNNPPPKRRNAPDFVDELIE